MKTLQTLPIIDCDTFATVSVLSSMKEMIAPTSSPLRRTSPVLHPIFSHLLTLLSLGRPSSLYARLYQVNIGGDDTAFEIRA